MNEEKKQGKHIKLIIFIGLILVILVLNHIFGWSEYIGNINNLKKLDEMVENNLPVALALYMGLTIVGCVALALPGITFAIAAGLLFGPLLGTIACSVATTIGAMLAFIAGRFFLKDSIKPAAMKNKWLFDETGSNEIFILMITRLVPLFPYNLQNFAYGVTDIKFVTYSVCSLLFMLPGTAMYTVGTAGLADKENRILYIGIAIVLAIVVIVMGAFLKKKYVQPEESVEKEHEA